MFSTTPKMPTIMKLPTPILAKILSEVPGLCGGTSSLSKRTIYSMSTICRVFRDAVLCTAYSSIVVTSPSELEQLLEKFQEYPWEGQKETAKKLVLRWNVVISTYDGISFQSILGSFWRQYGWGIRELEFDFPGAAKHFEDAVLRQRITSVAGELKKLVLRHAGIAMFPPPLLLLHALSEFSYNCLQELVLEGSCSMLEDSWTKFQDRDIEFIQCPGQGGLSRNCFRLDSLAKLEIIEFAGVTPQTLLWLLEGRNMMEGRKKTLRPTNAGRELRLQLNPHLYKVGIQEALKWVGNGLDKLSLAFLEPKNSLSHLPLSPTRRTRSTSVADVVRKWEDAQGGMRRRLEPKEDSIHLCDVVRDSCSHLTHLNIHLHCFCRELFFPPTPILNPLPIRMYQQATPSASEYFCAPLPSKVAVIPPTSSGRTNRAVPLPGFVQRSCYTQLKVVVFTIARDHADRESFLQGHVNSGPDPTSLIEMKALKSCDGEPAWWIAAWAQEALQLGVVKDYVRIKGWRSGGEKVFCKVRDI
ncbi:hypothetical protein RUND412_007026 [Rhizina undulata]